MRPATLLLAALGLAAGAGRDDRARELCAAFQKALDDNDAAARTRITGQFLEIGRPALSDIRNAREAWGNAQGRELARLEGQVKAVSGQVEALASKPKLSPAEEPILKQAMKDLEDLRLRHAPLRRQREYWETLETEVARCPAARVSFMPDDKNPTPNRVIMLSYLSALLNGDESARRGWFEQLIRLGPDGIAESRIARSGWRKAHDAKLKELQDLVRTLQAELDRAAPKDEPNREVEQPVLERLAGARAAVARFESQIAHLEWLGNELELRLAWKEGRPLLDSMVNTVRSFDNFGRLGRWAEAAKCVEPATEDQARKLFKPLRSACTLAVGAEGWHFGATWLPKRAEAANLVLLGATIRNGTVISDGRFAFEGADAVIAFVEGEGRVKRMSRVTTGELYDPRKTDDKDKD